MESVYDYGARAGFWRLHRLFTTRAIPVTIFGVATALARSPEQVAAIQGAGWELASHGLKWVEHRDMPEAEERRAIDAAIRLHKEVNGTRPTGWYTGRCSVNTLRLIAEEGGFAYASDAYDDDLPYWKRYGTRDQLVIPYTLEANDMRFATAPGYVTGREFGDYLIDAFDVLHAEGAAGAPKLLSIGLHNRLIGRPGKIAGLIRFLDHAEARGGVWFARRIDIARHWAAEHPPKREIPPSEMTRAEFTGMFGGVYEHSPWIADGAWLLELGPAHDRAEGLWNALTRVFRAASVTQSETVLTAHPDLAGKLAQAKRLTADSTAEQASAGLDALTDAERAEFTRLNTAYMEKFGFPFIIAVRDHDRAQILAAFRRRLDQDRPAEFAEACRQVERIAWHRVRALLS
jgi:chitin deacetylase